MPALRRSVATLFDDLDNGLCGELGADSAGVTEAGYGVRSSMTAGLFGGSDSLIDSKVALNAWDVDTNARVAESQAQATTVTRKGLLSRFTGGVRGRVFGSGVSFHNNDTFDNENPAADSDQSFKGPGF